MPPVSAFSFSLPLRNYSRSKTASRTAKLSRAVFPRMTLQPQDSSYRHERDRLAIESEFLIPVTATGEVDAHMNILRERIQTLDRKEKQWSDIVSQFTSMSMLTGIPFVDSNSGEPTFRAWVFLTLGAVVPLYVVYMVALWLHDTSLAFEHLF